MQVYSEILIRDALILINIKKHVFFIVTTGPCRAAEDILHVTHERETDNPLHRNYSVFSRDYKNYPIKTLHTY